LNNRRIKAEIPFSRISAGISPAFISPTHLHLGRASNIVLRPIPAETDSISYKDTNKMINIDYKGKVVLITGEPPTGREGKS
jgi:hypothetical protein